MNINDPILHSMLDDDWYKITQGSIVFHLFPRAVVTYEFINRGKTPFPLGFSDALQIQVNEMQKLQLTNLEAQWLKTIPYIRPTYIEWLHGYRLDPSEVTILQEGSDLRIKIHGLWYRTIYWEVKLMAVISELYFKMTNQTKGIDWKYKIAIKSTKLNNDGCHWIDFGTRRRYSYQVQDEVVRTMKNYSGFLGTSNPHFAHLYGITPHGTYAHESVMAMSSLFGVRMANKMWMQHWSEHYEGNVGIALTDTFTTEEFLHNFGSYEARLFDGVRQDSGDPMAWGVKMLQHYDKLNIPTDNKRLVFSDNLNDDKYIKLDKYFRQWAQPIGGIGTFLTNDVGISPLNMVIKMVSADFGHGPIDVVKLSDDPSKSSGDPKTIKRIKEDLFCT